MSFQVEPISDHTVIIRVGTLLDFRNADAFKATCRGETDAGKRRFILDFSETELLDSVGLGAIFSLYRTITPEDGQIVMAGAKEAVAVMVQMTKIDRIFPQFATVEEALTAL